VYLIAVTGITGARDQLAAGLSTYIARVRGYTELPLAIGFGISRREHVEQAEQLTDGVVVGTALLNYLERAPSEELPIRAKEFMRELRGVQAGEQSDSESADTVQRLGQSTPDVREDQQ
jgi:tryptophan synthase alpha chain